MQLTNICKFFSALNFTYNGEIYCIENIKNSFSIYNEKGLMAGNLTRVDLENVELQGKLIRDIKNSEIKPLQDFNNTIQEFLDYKTFSDYLKNNDFNLVPYYNTKIKIYKSNKIVIKYSLFKKDKFDRIEDFLEFVLNGKRIADYTMNEFCPKYLYSTYAYNIIKQDSVYEFIDNFYVDSIDYIFKGQKYKFKRFDDESNIINTIYKIEKDNGKEVTLSETNDSFDNIKFKEIEILKLDYL